MCSKIEHNIIEAITVNIRSQPPLESVLYLGILHTVHCRVQEAVNLSTAQYYLNGWGANCVPPPPNPSPRCSTSYDTIVERGVRSSGSTVDRTGGPLAL